MVENNFVRGVKIFVRTCRALCLERWGIIGN